MTRKKDKGRRAELAAAPQNLPVGPMVHQAADKIGPLAHEAAEKIGPLAHQAADVIGPFAQEAAERLAPLAQAASDRVQPYAQQAVDRVRPYAERAAERIEPYAHQAAERLGPYAETAKRQGAHAAAEAVEKWGPVLDEATGKIPPAIEVARERVYEEALPAIAERLHEIADADVVAAASKKAAELVPVKPAKKKGRWGKRFAILAGVLAAGGVAYVAAKKLLGGGQENEWEAARPATPYSSTTITEPQPGAAAKTGTDSVAASAHTAPEPDEVADAEPATEADSKPAHAADEVEATEAGTGEESGTESKYGEGSFIGSEPPEGFTIKGNERSMKYHVSDSTGYDRTNADVWFNSESAAQAAGFSKAQR
ncbi:hypothetical protein FOE78_18545 [Microlunatus elymi]|uniref:Uncharacterized protein n=1 Tax=Microlunatus elymi TaxID=2596828 RepID=A0A516Q2N0_9ACTN|nr:hypothetical protein [Microlunatus elymi]QDP97642.1 hypothetical protein FOE78_18545 [Microlunatus elymi]